jgi:hypothetical protein
LDGVGHKSPGNNAFAEPGLGLTKTSSFLNWDIYTNDVSNSSFIKSLTGGGGGNEEFHNEQQPDAFFNN